MQWDLRDRETIFASLPRGGIGAEIGVDWGEFSKVIFQRAEPRLLYLIDCWEEQPVEIYGHDPANSAHDVKYKQCLRWFATNEQIRMIKAYSLDAAPCFPDQYFDWLYIDANHLQCYADIRAWWPKVKSGGWMMGHDYVTGGVGDYITVAKDVDRFVAETGLPVLLTDDEIYKNWIVQKP
jgi:hypothetical protein